MALETEYILSADNYLHTVYRIDGVVERRLSVSRDMGTDLYYVRHVPTNTKLFHQFQITDKNLAIEFYRLAHRLIELYKSGKVSDFYEALNAIIDRYGEGYSVDEWISMFYQISSVVSTMETIQFIIPNGLCFCWDRYTKLVWLVEPCGERKEELKVDPLNIDKIMASYNAEEKEIMKKKTGPNIWTDYTGETPKEIDMDKLLEVEEACRQDKLLEHVGYSIEFVSRKIKALDELFGDDDKYRMFTSVFDTMLEELNNADYALKELKGEE